MAKKKKGGYPSNGNTRGKAEETGSKQQEGGATLKELLGADVLGKLKAQADELKRNEAEIQERKRQEAEEAKRREQKLRENDFAYLLENSKSGGGKYS
ncbi:YqkE family protein [Paenibacillus sp. CAU 1782]